jgi:hypothetical protein
MSDIYRKAALVILAILIVSCAAPAIDQPSQSILPGSRLPAILYQSIIAGSTHTWKSRSSIQIHKIRSKLIYALPIWQA